jgi:hypothetical protein
MPGTTSTSISAPQNCFNRMVMVECDNETCPGIDCGNKRLQLRQYPKLKPIKTEGR